MPEGWWGFSLTQRQELGLLGGGGGDQEPSGNDILVLYLLSSHRPPFLSWPVLLFFLLRALERWKK